MCLERIHRFMMAGVLSLGAYFISLNMVEGQYILWFVIAMLAIFGATDFCLSITIMKKLGLKSCSVQNSEEK